MNRWNQTTQGLGFIRRVSEIEDENENDDEDAIWERLSRSESDPLEPRQRAKNYSCEPAECAFDGFECLYPQAADKTCAEKDLYSPVACYRKLRSQQAPSWKECNRRLYHYYQKLAPQLPDNFRKMEPLFLAVICGCNADLFREALHEVYIPRIQRGNAFFTAKVLGARGALLSVLMHFFEHRRWGSPVETAVEGQSHTAEDQLFILMQAAAYLRATRGMGAPEARICYERAETLCQSLGRPLLLYVALIGQFRYTLMTDKLSAAMQVAERVYSLSLSVMLLKRNATHRI
jgi:hypothetical protein